MKAARYVLGTISAIGAIVVTLLGASKHPSDHMAAIYVGIGSIGALIASLVVYLKEQNRKSQVDLRITPLSRPLDERAASLERALSEVQRRFAERHLTAAQRSQLIGLLSATSGGFVHMKPR